jgi:hypothetical protein
MAEGLENLSQEDLIRKAQEKYQQSLANPKSPLEDLSHDDLIKLANKKFAINTAADQIAQSGAPNASQGESFLRGLSQGLTAHFQDEISPYIEKGLALAKTNPIANTAANLIAPGITAAIPEPGNYEGSSISDLTKGYREQNKAAQKSNPGTYLGGDVVGNVVSSFAVPSVKVGPLFGGGLKAGLLNLTKGSAIGAAEGAGYAGANAAGEAEQNKVQAGLEAAKTGAEIGGALGGTRSSPHRRGGQKCCRRASKGSEDFRRCSRLDAE